MRWHVRKNAPEKCAAAAGAARKKKKMRSDALTTLFEWGTAARLRAVAAALPPQRPGTCAEVGFTSVWAASKEVWGARGRGTAAIIAPDARAQKGEKFVPISTPRQPVTHFRVWFSDR